MYLESYAFFVQRKNVKACAYKNTMCLQYYVHAMTMLMCLCKYLCLWIYTYIIIYVYIHSINKKVQMLLITTYAYFIQNDSKTDQPSCNFPVWWIQMVQPRAEKISVSWHITPQKIVIYRKKSEEKTVHLSLTQLSAGHQRISFGSRTIVSTNEQESSTWPSSPPKPG